MSTIFDDLPAQQDEVSKTIFDELPDAPKKGLLDTVKDFLPDLPSPTSADVAAARPARRRDTMLPPVNAPRIDDDLSAPVGVTGQPLTPPQANVPPTWGDVGGGLVDAATGTAKYITGAPTGSGAPQPGMAADLVASLARASGMTAGVMRAAGEQMRAAPFIPGINMIPNQVLDPVNEWLGKQANIAKATAERISPPQPEGSFRGAVSSGVQSAGQSALMLPAAIATGNPMLMLAPLALGQGGESYQKAREAGRSPGTALGYGASDALIEYATERLPGIKLLTDIRTGTPMVKTVLHNLATEVPGEQIATMLQDLNEWAVINVRKGKTFMDYVAERPGAAWSTLLSTLVTSGAMGAAAKIGQSRAAPPPLRADQAAQQQEAEGGSAADTLAAALGAQPYYEPRANAMHALRQQQTEAFNQQREAANVGPQLPAQPPAVPPASPGQPVEPAVVQPNFQVPGTVYPGGPGQLGAVPPTAAVAPGGPASGPGAAVAGPEPQYLSPADNYPGGAAAAPGAAVGEPAAVAVGQPAVAPTIFDDLPNAPAQQPVQEPAAAAAPVAPVLAAPKLIDSHLAALKTGDPAQVQDTLAAMKQAHAQLEAKFNAGDATGTDIGNMNALEYHITKAEQAAAPPQAIPLPEPMPMGVKPEGEPHAVATPTAAPGPAQQAGTAQAPAAAPAAGTAPQVGAAPVTAAAPQYPFKPSPQPSKPSEAGAKTAGPVQPAGGFQYATKTAYPASTVTPSKVDQSGKVGAPPTPAAKQTPLQAMKGELNSVWAGTPSDVKKDPAGKLFKDSRLHALWSATVKKDAVPNVNLVHALDWADTHQRSDIAKQLRKRMAERVKADPQTHPELAARLAQADPYKGKVTHGPATGAAASASTGEPELHGHGVAQPGGPLSSFINPTTPAFWKWFGDSKVVDSKGHPRVMFHGTTKAGDVTVFEFGQGYQGKAIFTTPGIDFAKSYAGWGSKSDEAAMKAAGITHFYPVYVRAENPFDYQDKVHVSALVDRLFKDNASTGDAVKLDGTYIPKAQLTSLLAGGSWSTIEKDAVREAVIAQGHDGYYVTEGKKKNLALFSAHQLKSAVKNTGEYSITDPSQFADLELPEYDHGDMMEARDQADVPEFDAEEAAADQELAAGETAPQAGETAPETGEVTAADSDKPVPSHVGQTRRASEYVDAWHDAGVSPGVGASMSFGKSFGILNKLWQDKYGITVQVGKAARKWETTAQMLDGYRNVGWMMSVLQLPQKAAGLDGSLKLRLDKMKPGILGSFNAGTKVMEMPGRSNSFAHEWGHVLDNYLLEKLGLNDTGKAAWLTHMTAQHGIDVSTLPEHLKPLGTAFARLVNVLHKDEPGLAAETLKYQRLASMAGADGSPTPQAVKAQSILDEMAGGKQAASKTVAQTQYVQRAKAADKAGGSNYWKKPAELMARSFETYVAHLSEQAHQTMEATGHIRKGDEFITKGDKAYLSDGSAQFAKLYPKEAERQGIFLAWTELMQAVRDSEVLGHKGDIVDVGASVLKEDAGPAHQEQGGRTASLWRRELRGWRSLVQPSGQAKLPIGQRVDKAVLGGIETALQSLGSQSGLLNFYQAQTGSGALMKLNKMLFRNVGVEGQREQRSATYEEEMHQHMHSQNTRQLQEERRLFGVGHKYSHAEDAYLRHIMTAQEESSDQDVQRLIAQAPHQGLDAQTRVKLDHLAQWLRNKQLVTQYRYLKDAGVKVGEADSFLPRQYNQHVILESKASQADFQQRAAKVYGIQFGNNAGTDHTDFDQEQYDKALTRLGFKYKGDNGQVSNHAADLARELRGMQRELTKLQAEKQAAQAAGTDASAFTDQIDRLQRDIDNHLDELLPALREDYGNALATDWLNRMRTGSFKDAHAKQGPSASFTKHRTLPKEADTLLAPYLHDNVPELVREYVERSTKKALYSKYFGTDQGDVSRDGEKLEDLFRQMADQGVSRPVIDEIRKIVNNVTGRNHNVAPAKFEQVMSNIRMLGSFTMLARSAWASAAEPMQLVLNTGNLWDATRLVSGTLRSVFSRASAEDFRAIGERLGIVTLPWTSNPNMDHNANEHFTKRQQRYYGTFFTLSGLTPLTNWQRTQVVMPGSMQFIKDLLVKPEHQGSRKELAQWGIPEDQQKAVAEWLDKLGRVPVEKDLVDPNTDLIWDEQSPAGLYARALRNIITHTVTDPYKIDRPYLMGNPVAQSTFALTGFAFGHWSKFYKPILRKLNTLARAAVLGEKGTDLGLSRSEAIFKSIPAMAAGAASLYAATFVFSLLREMLYNFARWSADDWDEKKQGTKLSALMWLALDRTGFWGPFDPIKQAFVSTKYQRALSQSLAGPYLGNMLTNIDAVWKGATQPGPTNTHNAVKALYMLTVANALGMAQAAAPGPVSGILAAAANMWGGTNMVGDKVAELAGAPKPPKHGGGGSGTKFTTDAEGKLIAIPKGKEARVTTDAAGNLVPVPKGKKGRFTTDASGKLVAY